MRDNPVQTAEAAILDSNSPHYRKSHLWTYGFIRALLEYCSLEEHQHGRMIRFEEKTVLHVDKCSRADVLEVRDEMERKGKVLPFFVLDEMTPNVNTDGGGKDLAAFQRNVFCACYLVVIVMGTDVKVTNFVSKSGGSFKRDHKWVTIVSRFPSYRPIPFKCAMKQCAWDRVKQQYPIVETIAVGSRKRFARYFVDSVVETVLSRASVELCDLLDQAFTDVSRKTQVRERLMWGQNGKDAQLTAISNSNTHVELLTNTKNDKSEPALKKRKLENGAHCMNLHFANLVDDRLIVLYLSNGKLKARDEYWKPTFCLPSINEDMLLYLAVLGGKDFSGYYDFPNEEANSTKQNIKVSLEGKRFSTDFNTNAVKNDFMVFENMVARIIFCASRKNGVQGIRFPDFFAGLLGEIQDEYNEMKTKAIIDNKEEDLVADVIKLFAGYAALSETKIPFLAPPNTQWPNCLLETRRHGCNFRQLVCAPGKESCDVYVGTADDNSGGAPILLCECKYWSKNLDMGTMKKDRWWSRICVEGQVDDSAGVLREIGEMSLELETRNKRGDWVRES